MAEVPDIAIVGPGKVGTAIGLLAARANLRVVAVGGRRPGRARQAARSMGPNVLAVSPAEAAAAGGLVLLTISDEAVRPVCEQLADQGAFVNGAVVAHCCGALGSDVLKAARDRCACSIGSMHPLQTFPTAAAAIKRLPGAYCFCEGDAPALTALERLASAIGATPVRISSADKAAYHTAAVMACNYLSALLDAAAAVAGKAGIDPHTYLTAAEPLVRATVDNIFAMGPEKALTGPIARGDADTVRRHLEQLPSLPEDLGNFYRAAGKWTIDLARRKGTIDASTAKALEKLLRGGNET